MKERKQRVKEQDIMKKERMEGRNGKGETQVECRESGGSKQETYGNYIPEGVVYCHKEGVPAPPSHQSSGQGVCCRGLPLPTTAVIKQTPPPHTHTQLN